MKLITPYHLDYETGLRVAVVGNASTVLSWGAGAQIDACDLVIRFNEARTVGYEKDVGTRTDILFTNVYQSIDNCAPPASTLRPRHLICLLGKRDRQADFSRFERWAEGCPTLFSWAPDILPSRPVRRTRSLTTGVYALYLIKEWLKPSALFVTGFTAFLEESHGHYWTDARPPALFFHDLDVEAKALADVLTGFPGELTLTPEVDALLGGSRRIRKRSLSQKISGRAARVFLRMATALRRFSEQA